MKHKICPSLFVGSLLSLLAFVAGAALLSAACLVASSPLSYLTSGVWTAFCVVTIVHILLQAALLPVTRTLGELPRAKVGTSLVSALAALSLLALAASMIVVGVRGTGVSRVFPLLIALFSLVSTVGFALRAVYRGKYPSVEILTSLALPLACVLFALYLYFEKSIPRNASWKLVLSLCFLFLALWLTADIRYEVGNPKPRLYHLLGRVTAPLLGAVAVASVVLGAGRGLSYLPATVYILFAVFFLYIIVNHLPASGISFERAPADGDESGAPDFSDADSTDTGSSDTGSVDAEFTDTESADANEDQSSPSEDPNGKGGEE